MQLKVNTSQYLHMVLYWLCLVYILTAENRDLIYF